MVAELVNYMQLYYTAELVECVDNCDINAQCIDTLQGFQCVCNPGFTGDGITCTGSYSYTIIIVHCSKVIYCM